MAEFAIGDADFLLDGHPFRILSGALHYFRVHPDLWADRLRKARLMGLNTVETYVPWNLHQPEPGTLVLDGLLDLPRFLRLAQAEGLKVLLRPGPYICAEWDGGGLPHWLMSESDVQLRSSDPKFTAIIDRYLDLLLPPLLPHMAASGGPVIAVQVENEYGAYGNDAAYLKHLVEAFRSRGIDELLFTCDQVNHEHQEAGGIPGVLATGTFGGKIDTALATLREHQPEGPLMCAEFWIGWFDHWGGPHHVRDAADAAAAATHDFRFHDELVRHCGNEQLLGTLRPLKRRLLRYELAYMAVARNVGRSVGQHAEIVDALERDDRDAAAAAVEANFREALPGLLERVAKET